MENSKLERINELARLAKERELTIDTIMGHLVRYTDSGQVAFSALVPPDHEQAIRRVISRVGTAENSATPIKALCPPEVTYTEVRLVMNKMKRQ